MSFLSAAFDPQEIVQRSQSYEGFMPISGSAGWLGSAKSPANFHKNGMWAHTVHGIFDRTVKKSEKLQKSVQKNRNINKKRKTEM